MQDRSIECGWGMIAGELYMGKGYPFDLGLVGKERAIAKHQSRRKLTKHLL